MQRRQDKDHHHYVVHLFEQNGCYEFSKKALVDESHLYDFIPDGLFEENQQIRIGNEHYETIWAPGHSADQFCFYQREQQIMILGDHVLERISPVVLIQSAQDLNPLHDDSELSGKNQKLFNKAWTARRWKYNGGAG